MSTFPKFILWLLLSTVNVGEAKKDVTQLQIGTKASSKASTYVVDLSFCSLGLGGKKTLEEIHT